MMCLRTIRRQMRSRMLRSNMTAILELPTRNSAGSVYTTSNGDFTSVT